MRRHSKKTREEARQLYLTGEVTSVAEIVRRETLESLGHAGEALLDPR